MNPWPFHDLVITTPRLELRPDDDAGLLELAAEAQRGVHPPERMPFAFPWTDAAPDRLATNTLQHHWRMRAALTPDDWSLNFLVRLDGRVIGTQSAEAKDFAATREITTGSWIGLRHQGAGLGTEMRAAVLAYAFDHLGAVQARSAAWEDNAASLAVSRKLGYRPDGTKRAVRRGVAVTEIRLLVTREQFTRPTWNPTVEGHAACAELLTA